MNFKFFFIISYSVIYAKYYYCYEVPKNMPLRYFDGKDWKVMKPRDYLKTEISRYPSIPLELDWAELNEELCESEQSSTSTETTTTLTTATTPKTTPRSTTTTKMTTKCMKPRITMIKMTTKTTKPKIPTKKITMKTTKATTKYPSACSLKLITPNCKIIRINNKLMTTTARHWTTTKKLPTTTKISPPKTAIKPPPKTTDNPPSTTTNAAQFSGKQRNEQLEMPENWWNFMSEFVEAVRSVDRKNCQPPALCDSETTTKPNSVFLLADAQRSFGITGFEDLLNILTDGVEIDNRPDDEDDDTFQNKALVGFKEVLENQEPILYFDSVKGLVPRETKINKDNLHDLDLKTYRNGIKAKYLEQGDESSQQPDASEYEEEAKVKNYMQELDFNSYLDAKSARHTTKIKDIDIRKYLDATKEIYAEKDNLQDVSLESDEREAIIAPNHTKQEIGNNSNNKDILEDLDLKSVINAFAAKYIRKEKYSLKNNVIEDVHVKKDNPTSRDVMLDSDKIKSFIAINQTDSTEITSQTNTDDIFTIKDDLQYKDIKLDLKALEGEDEKADKDCTEDIQVELQQGQLNDKDAADGIDEQKESDTTEYKIIKNYEDIPLFNFKYALDDRKQNEGSTENRVLIGW